MATVTATATSVAWYFLVNKARRDNYANFYKNYDAEADFQRMKAAGVFQSVKVQKDFVNQKPLIRTFHTNYLTAK